MPWTNYHSHTYYCDGKNNPQDYIEEAIDQNLIAYGYSSHAPVPFDCDWTVPQIKISQYISDVLQIKNKYSDKIQVYLGLEVDYIPNITGPQHENISTLNLDYNIGSIHFVDSFKDGERWSIDWTYDYFMKGLKEIFNNDAKKCVKRFYELTKMMLSESTPVMIGHFDKIRMYNKNNDLFDENKGWYINEIEDVLKLIKEKNVIIEINTRGHYKAGSEIYPHPSILKQIKKMSIPISVNSDSHKPDEITKGYQYAFEALLNAGIDETWSLVNNKWQPYKFHPVKGLL